MRDLLEFRRAITRGIVGHLVAGQQRSVFATVLPTREVEHRTDEPLSTNGRAAPVPGHHRYHNRHVCSRTVTTDHNVVRIDPKAPLIRCRSVKYSVAIFQTGWERVFRSEAEVGRNCNQPG